MNRITIDPEALHHNLEVIRERVADHGARMTVVTKALCGNADAVRALAELGVRSMAYSRLRTSPRSRPSSATSRPGTCGPRTSRRCPTWWPPPTSR